MSFKSVWGFDPEEVSRSKEFKRRDPNIDSSEHEFEDQSPPNMPFDVHAQINELRRMFES
jgi:hypothetical protein